MTLLALYFHYIVDPRLISVSGLTFVVNSFGHGPSLWSFSDSLWLICSGWSPLMNGDCAVSMSGVFMAWYGSVSRSSTAMALSAMWTTLDLPFLRCLRVPHCSSVIFYFGGLASWTLVVTALLKFLTLSASAVLTSDQTLVSISWLRCTRSWNKSDYSP